MLKILDIGCGQNKRGSVGMDKRAMPGVDVVHDLEVLPWPFKDDEFDAAIAWHVFEHVKPWLMIDIMNEAWRVIKKDGTLDIGMPCPESFGFYMEPTHIRTWNEVTPTFFDPDYEYYNHYYPKPWKIIKNDWYIKDVPKTAKTRGFNGSMHITMRKR